LAKGGDDRLLRHSTVVSIQDESYPLKNKRRAGLTQGVKSGSGMINGLVQVGHRDSRSPLARFTAIARVRGPLLWTPWTAPKRRGLG